MWSMPPECSGINQAIIMQSERGLMIWLSHYRISKKMMNLYKATYSDDN